MNNGYQSSYQSIENMFTYQSQRDKSVKTGCKHKWQRPMWIKRLEHGYHDRNCYKGFSFNK